MTDRRELADRLEAVECGSRELDDALFVSFFEDPCAKAKTVVGGGVIVYGPGFYAESAFVPPVTTSLDAALALAERVLPGWAWQLSPTCAEIAPERWHYAESAGENRGQTVYDPPTPALGLCAAILRARLDDEGKGGDNGSGE